ncbi:MULTISPECIES: glycosyltransferase [unclassified Streptomyces]|uniref:glycosyltransferase n=1 Tax=unclassified Streptomyces TaxID=2593676 RepID=UPI00225388BD|nr:MULTISPECIES: glycosyltransferase [unclassified Streptomyces]MCX5054443.1 glycosyltransferase [Streptomyces sp. NBC_00474]MCX5062965.1 glycosyltransferase [Streptomyces sp. NBC_00452]MCX5250819.1 glycosyltransferase [Streptomyces sp. NBC_00201]MCX5291252.1 glycosyltransferase [Streptomyces sp. NBC_00183]
MTRTVLHIAQPSDAGVARVVTDLAAGQCAHGDRVVVACPADGTLSCTAAQRGAQVMRWDAVRSPGPALPREVAAVRRIVDGVRPDVVHLHSAKAGLAGRLAIRGRLPTVYQPHAWSFDAATAALRTAVVQWERAGARWAHRVVCVSEGERAHGLATGIRCRYAVVRNGVDLDWCHPSDASSHAAARHRLGVSFGGPLAVCVARLCRQKGQDVLLDAWDRIEDLIPRARLVLVGAGPDRAVLAARASPGVCFAGAVVDPHDWYIAADLVVLASRWEAGMALAPLEAMACSRPVVVTDVPGAREFLPPRHVPFAIVPLEEPVALAAALSRLLTDPATGRALGEEARTHIRRHHDVRHVVERMYTVYDDARRTWSAGPDSMERTTGDASVP